MTTVQHTFPVPPQALWNALPAGVAAIGGQGPFYDAQQGFVSCRTGMSMLSWGQEVTVTIAPSPDGATLTMLTNLKFGVYDWGEGKRLGKRFVGAIAHATGTPVPA